MVIFGQKHLTSFPSVVQDFSAILETDMKARIVPEQFLFSGALRPQAVKGGHSRESRAMRCRVVLAAAVSRGTERGTSTL